MRKVSRKVKAPPKPPKALVMYQPSADADNDCVDSLAEVARRWNWSDQSIMREVKAGKIKLTRLGSRRVGIRRSEQRRYLDKHTG